MADKKNKEAAQPVEETTEIIDPVATLTRDEGAKPAGTVEIPLRPGQVVIRLKDGTGKPVAINEKQFGEDKPFKPDVWEIVLGKKN